MSALARITPLVGENSLFKAVGDVFHPLFELVGAVLAFIYGIIPNYAVAIILLTILIMALLTPLTIKSTRSMIAMQALQPELQKLRQKYKGAENREQLNQEMMRLYREQGVSPTGGCLPMFLQMPALIVLYDTIKGLTNTIKAGTKFPKGTVLPTGHVANGLMKCTAQIGAKVGKTILCAVPRYIPNASKMYHNLVNSPGVMKSFGLNLALKPLSHHNGWIDYVPYVAMVAVAVGLQYFQMSQMTKRNKAAAQMNPQMQTMQKVMPLIFAYIYFLIPAGVVVYMIVSSAIRILTQDLIFRYGIVQRPGEREIGAGAKKGLASRLPQVSTALAPVEAEEKEAKPATGTRNGSGGGARKPATSKAGSARSGAGSGTTDGTTAPKAHPRSKSKRARKAR